MDSVEVKVLQKLIWNLNPRLINLRDVDYTTVFGNEGIQRIGPNCIKNLQRKEL